MGGVVILGVFVADTAYRADRPPRMGETILGNASSSARAARARTRRWRRRGSARRCSLITRLGEDAFAEMALATWAEAGVRPVVTAGARELHRRGLHLHRGGDAATTPSSSAPARRPPATRAKVRA